MYTKPLQKKESLEIKEMGSNIWFTSDLHLSHANIICYCMRPFSNYFEMDACIINNINKVVKPQDTLWILGDFSFGNKLQIDKNIDRINCKHICLILGNHDRQIIHHIEYYKQRFQIIDKLSDIKIGNIMLTLCHYSMQRWNKSHHGALHLFGHSHGTIKGIGKSMDVGVDTNNFRPYNFDQITNLLS